MDNGCQPTATRAVSRGRARRRSRWTPRGPPRSPRAARRTGRGRARRGPPPRRPRRPRRRRGGWPTRCRRCTPRTRPRATAPAPAGTARCRPAPGVAVRRPGDRGVDRGERVGRGDRPVAARDQPGTGPVQVAEGVLPARPLLAEERHGQVDHLLVVAGPERLHVRGDPELRRTAARRRGGPAAGARSDAGGRGSVPTIASRVSRTARSPMVCTCTWKPAASSAADRVAQRLPRRGTSGRGCRWRGRTGRGRARAARRCRSRPRRPASP